MPKFSCGHRRDGGANRRKSLALQSSWHHELRISLPAPRFPSMVATRSDNGERVVNIEFGFRLSADLRHLEPDPAEQAALAEIRNLRRQGHTLRGIAATINNRGHRTRRGTEWRLESVARVVKQNALPPHAKSA